MRKFGHWKYIPATLLFIIAATATLADDEDSPPPTEAERWRYLQDEQRISALLVELAREHPPRAMAIVGVTRVETAPPRLVPAQTVLIDNGRITQTGPAGEVTVPQNARSVDGTGKFLLPGLVDAHVHTLVSNAHHLLNLVNGVTTVREMCGFPWMLRFRQQARDNRILAPNVYLTGPILNGAPLGMYGIVVRNADHARSLVRDHQTAGYDFIKVHNVMNPAYYQAIVDEARKLGIDVVGHIPHEITLKQAIAQGQRTIEHLKGYYLDTTLEMTKENYVELTRGAEVWNCPTFYTSRVGLRGDDVRTLLEREEGRYVPPYERAAWLAVAERGKSENTAKIRKLSEQIFRELVSINARFLAGTDSGGGYPMMVPGFALHEELHVMVENGLPIAEAIRAATANPAAAMRREREFGAIEPGFRADLLLLSRNPLDAVENLSAIDGVCVRGVWLDSAALDDIKRRIRSIYDDGSSMPGKELLPSADQMNQLARSIAEMDRRGFVFMDHYLEELAELLKKNGQPAEAIRAIRQAASKP